MNTVKIRQTGDPIETRDARMLARGRDGKLRIMGGAQRDTVVDTDFRIDTDTRIEAEAAPDEPDLGTVSDGATVRRIAGAVRAASEEGMLSDEEVAAIREIVTRASGRSAGPTGRTGVTSNDAISQARRAVREVRRGVDAISDIQEANKKFWDPRVKEDGDLIRGR